MPSCPRRAHLYRIESPTSDRALYDGDERHEAVTALAAVDLDSDDEAYAYVTHLEGDYCVRESQAVEIEAERAATVVNDYLSA